MDVPLYNTQMKSATLRKGLILLHDTLYHIHNPLPNVTPSSLLSFAEAFVSAHVTLSSCRHPFLHFVHYGQFCYEIETCKEHDVS